jgi:phage shock protein C
MIFPSKLYLDKDRKKIAGVCAGLADYLGWDVTAVRLGWIIVGLFWAPVMIVTYILAAWLLDPKPGTAAAAHREAAREQARGPIPADPSTPRHRYADVKERYTRLEERLRRLEGTVTSRAFQMDRELRNTGRS